MRYDAVRTLWELMRDRFWSLRRAMDSWAASGVSSEEHDYRPAATDLEAAGGVAVKAVIAGLTVTLLLGAGLSGHLAYRLVSGGPQPSLGLAITNAHRLPGTSPGQSDARLDSAGEVSGQAETPCPNAVDDGGFEAGTGWEIVQTAYSAGYVSRPAAYVRDPVRTGQRALRLGISDGPDAYSYSCAEQGVTIPAQATAAHLSFWLFSRTADSAGDVQFLLVLKENGGYDTLMWQELGAARWERREFPLDAYRGQRVVLHFGVLNDGDGARTVMYIDDVAVTLCAAATSTPAPAVPYRSEP